jgi:2-methylcitrate dehydratase PrpD
MDAPALERGRIKRIDVHTYAMAARLNAMHPTTPLGGRFSIPHVVAALLTLGHADPAAFGDAALRDPRLAQLRALVQVHEDPALSAMLPARRPARVRITLDDGQVVTHEVTRTKGDPDLPMTPAELRDKFIRLAAPTLGVARAAVLHAELGRLADLQRLPDHVFVTFANGNAA